MPILLDLWKLEILTVCEVAHDVADKATAARQVLPHVRIILLLRRVVHEILNLLDGLPGAGVANLDAALVTVPAVTLIIRLMKQEQKELLVRRVGLVILQGRVVVVDGECRVVDAIESTVPDPELFKLLLTVHDQAADPKFKRKFVTIDILARSLIGI